MKPRVAIVHEWFAVPAGSERVVDALLELLPDADLFALLAAVPGEPMGSYGGRRVTTTFVQRLAGADGLKYQRLLPLFPRAIESLDLSGYDLVLSSSHCVAHGVCTTPKQLHVSYCHTPVRYAWDMREQYLRGAGYAGPTRAVASWFLDRLKAWDVRTASRPDAVVVNSAFVGERVRRAWSRESTIVHPPVDLQAFALSTAPRKGFVAASRLVPYKQMPMIVRAFEGMPEESLTVIGDGPELDAVRRAAAGAANIRLLGRVPTDILAAELAAAEAMVFAALEDFGIAVVEAQACGTPVLAFGEGGARETVIEGQSGAFFPRQDEAAVQAAVRAFRVGAPYDPARVRESAERFSMARFAAGMAQVLAPRLQSRGFVYEPSVGAR